MRSLLIIAALSLSAVSFGQCVKCSSFKEAAKDPVRVKSIAINPTTGDEMLEEIPASIKLYTNLEELLLTDHGLTSVPKEIGSLTKLKTLSLAGNNLKELPEELFRLKQLEELILFDNPFTEEYLEELYAKMEKNMPNAELMAD
jgi:Leucine-rich repeat (LRR) protein